jgi:CheY-like chemotaxis protein
VRRRDEFLAMLSHELRNPLGAMVTATSLLNATDDAQRTRLIGVLDRQTKQTARLLDDLLEVTRVTENKIELRKTPLTGAPPPSLHRAERRDSPRKVRVSRVAVIEDNADSREMLCEVLSGAGFQCDSTDNGIAGLALIESTRPDVALIDVGLPGLNGLELAERLKASGRFPHLRLVALTGYGQQEDRKQAARAGYHAHFVKPVDPKHLVGFLRDGAQEAVEES